MRALLLAVLVLPGLAGAAVVDHDRREPAPADPPSSAPLFRHGTPSPEDPDLRLYTLLDFVSAYGDAKLKAEFEHVVECVATGGRASLWNVPDARNVPNALIACEYGPPHDPFIAGFSIPQSILDLYNSSYRVNLRIDGDSLAWGTGSAAPGGVPSLNYHRMGHDATLAFQQVLWRRATPGWEAVENGPEPGVWPDH